MISTVGSPGSWLIRFWNFPFVFAALALSYVIFSSYGSATHRFPDAPILCFSFPAFLFPLGTFGPFYLRCSFGLL